MIGIGSKRPRSDASARRYQIPPARARLTEQLNAPSLLPCHIAIGSSRPTTLSAFMAPDPQEKCGILLLRKIEHTVVCHNGIPGERSMFSRRKTESSAEGFDQYIADLKQAVDGVPLSAGMSMALFAVTDRAHARGMSEDQRTDVHVAGLCAYRDLCVVELMQQQPENFGRSLNSAMHNAQLSSAKFWTLVKQWDLSPGPITIPSED